MLEPHAHNRAVKRAVSSGHLCLVSSQLENEEKVVPSINVFVTFSFSSLPLTCLHFLLLYQSKDKISAICDAGVIRHSFIQFRLVSPTG